MADIAVAVLTQNREQLAALQSLVESTHAARLVFSHAGFPVNATDPVVRQMQNSARKWCSST
jgi:hypothetical protein